jgi:hypothetical protein
VLTAAAAVAKNPAGLFNAPPPTASIIPLMLDKIPPVPNILVPPPNATGLDAHRLKLGLLA